MVAKGKRSADAEADDYFHEVTPEEGRQLFDAEARRWLGMSGEEFLCAWDAGEIDPNDPERHSRIMHVVMLIPFARPSEPLPAGHE